MLEKVLGVCVVRHWLCLAAKSSHMGVNVDGLGCPLHHYTVYSCQTRGRSLMPGVVLSHH
jgi:hypothetical protein